MGIPGCQPSGSGFFSLLKDMDPVEEMAFVVHSLSVLFAGKVRKGPS